MKHFYIDRYSGIDSYIHRLDPRIKLLSALILIVAVIFTPPECFVCFGLYLILIAILIHLSKVPVTYILYRSLVIVPFVLMIAIFIPFFKKGEIAGGYSFGTLRLTVTYDGLMIFWNVLVKAYLSILSMILVMASTNFSDLLKALERLRLPRILTMVLSFMYRYIFVLQDELIRMNQAKESRSVGGCRWLHTKARANMLGTLFIRAYERGEQVYLAMCARGFNGNIRTMDNFRISKKDLYFLLVLLSLLVWIRIVGA